MNLYLILAVFAFVSMIIVYLAYRLHPKYKKMTPEEKRALKERRAIEFHEIIRKKLALRNALDKGLKISDLTMDQMLEMYMEDMREEAIQAAISQLDMTREEAIEKDFVHGRSQIAIELRCRKESQKLGRKITPRDLFEIDRERSRNSSYPGPDCVQPWELEYYHRHNKWPGEDPARHIKTCSGCDIMINSMKPVPVPPPGPDCYTQDELAQVVQTGNLPEGRLDHKKSCDQCRYKLSSAQGEFVDKIVPVQPFHMLDLDMDFGD